MSNPYPFGSPACVSKPKHGADPKLNRVELRVTFSKEFQNDGLVILSVTASDDDYFRGLLVQTKSPGVFLPTEGVALLECTGFLGSNGPDTKAVTHIDSTNKQSVKIQFVPDDGAEMEPEFKIVILKNFTMFWSDIEV